MGEAEATRGQFSVIDNVVEHQPTGAWWKARPNEAEPYAIYMGALGLELKNGICYDRVSVFQMALSLLEQRFSDSDELISTQVSDHKQISQS